MTEQQKPAASLPMGAIGVNMLGTALLVGGIGGLAVPAVAQSVPALADPQTAWTLIVTGLALEFWSVLSMIRRQRRR